MPPGGVDRPVSSERLDHSPGPSPPNPPGPPPPSTDTTESKSEDENVLPTASRSTYHVLRRRRDGGWMGFILVMLGIAAAVVFLVLLLMLASATHDAPARPADGRIEGNRLRLSIPTRPMVAVRAAERTGSA
jgi:hypothetical protein